MLQVVRCMLHVVWCVLDAAWCVLPGVLHAAWCVVHVAWCVLRGVCSTRRPSDPTRLGRPTRPSPMAASQDQQRRMLPVAGCMLYAACCTMPVARCTLHAARYMLTLRVACCVTCAATGLTVTESASRCCCFMRSAAFGNTSSIGVTFGLSVRIVRSSRARCDRRQATYKRVHVPGNHATNCVARMRDVA